MKKPIFDYKRKAKHYSYGGLRRLTSIEAVAIHWTEGAVDTAKNNCDYFADGNTRYAGAHIFIDYDGHTGLSVPLRRIAWSVMSKGYSDGAYGGIYDNTNTVSIELCGLRDLDDIERGWRYPSEKQLLALSRICRYIAKKCPNCKDVVRHYDIRRKPCPLPYVEDISSWQTLRRQLKVFFEH